MTSRRATNNPNPNLQETERPQPPSYQPRPPSYHSVAHYPDVPMQREAPRQKGTSRAIATRAGTTTIRPTPGGPPSLTGPEADRQRIELSYQIVARHMRSNAPPGPGQHGTDAQRKYTSRYVPDPDVLRYARRVVAEHAFRQEQEPAARAARFEAYQARMALERETAEEWYVPPGERAVPRLARMVGLVEPEGGKHRRPGLELVIDTSVPSRLETRPRGRR